MRRFATLLIAIMVLSLAGISLGADVPRMINYQGKLFDDLDNPVDDEVEMVFALYDSADAADALWTETHDAVNVVQGYFNVILGSVEPIPTDVFLSDSLYLGVSVDNGDELSPRRQLTSVGFAFRAAYADRAWMVYHEIVDVKPSSTTTLYIHTEADPEVQLFLYGEALGAPVGAHNHSHSHDATITAHTHTVSDVSGGLSTKTTSSVATSGTTDTDATTTGVAYSSYPKTVRVYVDGTDRSDALGGPWGNGTAEFASGLLDLSGYIASAGEHVIEIVETGNVGGRISYNCYVR